MKQKFIKKNKAFTLVETLVAISIFTVSILGLLSVLTTGVSNTTYDKNKIIAEYLAQEGIEYVRNMRDTYVLYPPNTWSDFKNKLASCTAGATCGFNNTVSPGPNSIISVCSPATLCDLYLYNGNYNIDHSSGVDSGFVRMIRIDATGLGNDEVKIYSEVDWKQGSNTSKIIFSENLFNWAQQ
jgi:type II secretory pathway pseudopilin PulG